MERTYDANGNRTGATINAQSSTYTYPTTSHRLTSVAGAVNCAWLSFTAICATCVVPAHPEKQTEHPPKQAPGWPRATG